MVENYLRALFLNKKSIQTNNCSRWYLAFTAIMMLSACIDIRHIDISAYYTYLQTYHTEVPILYRSLGGIHFRDNLLKNRFFLVDDALESMVFCFSQRYSFLLLRLAVTTFARNSIVLFRGTNPKSNIDTLRRYLRSTKNTRWTIHT